MQKILESIAATAELMGQQLSPTAAAIMANDLSAYPVEVVVEALAMLRRESKYKMTLAGVIEQIEKLQPDGRPGADEAWAMIPRDEYASVVWTDEMSVAFGIAQPLLDEGDQVAARMAFKEAYSRIVAANKLTGIKPKWTPSLGHDKEGRTAALADAVRLGRIGSDHATGLLPPQNIAPMLQAAGVPMLEHKPYPEDKAHENIARIKTMLNKMAA